MCLLPPHKCRHFLETSGAGCGQAQQCHNSSEELGLGKASLRIIFIVACVEFPLCWNRKRAEEKAEQHQTF